MLQQVNETWISSRDAASALPIRTDLALGLTTSGKDEVKGGSGRADAGEADVAEALAFWIRAERSCRQHELCRLVRESRRSTRALKTAKALYRLAAEGLWKLRDQADALMLIYASRESVELIGEVRDDLETLIRDQFGNDGRLLLAWRGVQHGLRCRSSERW